MRFVALGVVAALAACSSSAAIPEPTRGPATVITSVGLTANGYALTVRVTNADTGAVIYGPYCPGRIEVRFGGAWMPVEQNGVCRPVAKEIDAGSSIVLTVVEPRLIRGSEVRFVLTWNWFNGDGPVNGESVSAPVSLQ